MHIELLVEEPSAESALERLIPKILGRRTSFRIHVFQGKKDLLTKLPSRLRGYKRWLPNDYRIVVLIDADVQPCRKLKSQLENAAANAGFVTKSSARGNPGFHVLNRLAIEELEAWFFGDLAAIAAAYPRFHTSLGSKAPYRNPDSIRGGTWEVLERELQRLGYHSGGLEKIRAAKEIAAFMDPSVNRSKSFQVFRDGLIAL